MGKLYQVVIKMKFTNPSLPKRLSFLALTLALSAVVCIAGLVWPAPESESASVKAEISLPLQDTNMDAEHKLVLKDTDGVVCVYLDDELIYKTELPVISLPEQDRNHLAQGIEVTDETEMHQLLEDFGA